MPSDQAKKSKLKFVLPDLISTILNSYSDIFFIKGAWAGFVLLSISFINPQAGLSGLISIISAYLFASFIGYRKLFLNSGYFTYNALLVGLGISYLFELSFATLLFLSISGVLAFVLTAFLSHLFGFYHKLPILSIPFVIVSSLVYLAANRFSNLYVNNLYISPLTESLVVFPDWLNGFFKAMGAIIFMPHPLVGLLISLLLLVKSRIIVLLALSGFLLGTSINGLFTGSIPNAMQELASFNYILIAVALGAIFNIPTLKSYFIAFVGVSFATVLISSVDVFWSQYHIPIFTLPFTIVTLSIVYTLNVIEYPYRPIVFKDSPEQNLEHFIVTQSRFPNTPITLSLPFVGKWGVWQGFDGAWTHQGLFQHAYDFVIYDESGKSHQGEGQRLDDYYCYQQAVYSPVRGRVVQVVSHLKDNPIGSVDQTNNWGNFVVIQDHRGYFIELSHFSEASIAVYEGSWVEPGTYLGLCGNSGYSPKPHIHIQAQLNAFVGSATVPFTFLNYTEKFQYFEFGLPALNSEIVQSPRQLYYDQVTTFVLDEVFRYQVILEGETLEDWEFTVKMATDGTLFFDSGKTKLYLGKREGALYVYHIEGNENYMKMLYCAMSMVPLHYKNRLSWEDTLPNSVVLNGAQKLLNELSQIFLPGKSTTLGNYQFDSENQISGKITNSILNIENTTKLTLDPYQKIRAFSFNQYRFLRKINQ